MPICPACRSSVPAGFTFCGHCGHELTGSLAAEPHALPPGVPHEEPLEQRSSWARAHRGLVTALSAVAVIGSGTTTLFTVGYPMGWPLSPAFNMMFIVMGGVFVAIGVHAFLKPSSVKVGTTNSFGHMVGGRTATKLQGQAFGLLFVVVGIGMVVWANFLGEGKGEQRPPFLDGERGASGG